MSVKQSPLCWQREITPDRELQALGYMARDDMNINWGEAMRQVREWLGQGKNVVGPTSSSSSRSGGTN